jgi:pyruvate carboxylase
MNKVMAANRGEIAIRIFRACTELGIRTVAIYSHEDRLSLHRYKADEAYLVGKGKEPVAAYLDWEAILDLAMEKGVDTIHPGYGFLAENPQFARACQERGVTFVGPSPEVMELVGDKLRARQLAIDLGIPVIPGTPEPVSETEEALSFAEEAGYPVIIKAAAGGGGRGMRVARNKDELLRSLSMAQSEAEKSFGDSRVFLEKYLIRPKHIEIQILGDQHGNLVHLFERDCSIQRRHQKLIEIAPSLGLDPFLKERLYNYALILAREVNYSSAGTVEFLVDQEGNYYFIEVNPRIQVEHTVTEMITGRDLVQAQLRISQGESLKDLGIQGQESIKKGGYAVQCRVTTEDPLNNFLPDTGRIVAYRTAAGFGIRLDGGNGFVGARITPYYDPLLVKLTGWAINFQNAVAKLNRALREFRIRGVKTNIPFLLNVLEHPQFIEGKCDTTFVDTTPELFKFPERKDRGTKILSYIADVSINGFPGIDEKPTVLVRDPAPPAVSPVPHPSGTRDLLEKKGPNELSKWIREQQRLLITDTTFRDAHQSLMATRVRTYDMLQVAKSTAHLLPNLFSLEMWGGATFDVAMRFLKEDPWERVVKLKEKIPNILFQMLLRGANAVGYTNYPDNVVRTFVRESAQAGIDLFRIFDCFNWIEGMKVAIEEALMTDKLVEVSICYTGDITDPSRTKYTLDYYLELAQELETMGIHILAIKDMAGLCKPQAAYQLIKALKEEVSLPIHFHTHDTAGNGVASCLMASQAGVDIVDLAISSIGGLTAQPSMEAVVAALKGNEREPEVELENILPLASYWERVREFYTPFESGLKGPTGELYFHEIPGGQYSNLKPRAIQLGLGDRWEELKAMYARVNRLLGDLIKVTPSSKVVADLAIFMMKNNLTEEDLYERGDTLSFPESVTGFFKGMIGQPYNGFNEELQRVILKGEAPLSCRPGELLPPADFEAKKTELRELLGREPTNRDILSALLYPGVYEDFVDHQKRFSDTSVMKTPLFLYGLEVGQEDSVDIEEGKTLVIKLNAIGELLPDGTRVVHFELNGQPREVRIQDKAAQVEEIKRPKAEAGNPHHVGAPMPGKVVKILVNVGDKVEKRATVCVVEAMKVETAVITQTAGKVKEIMVARGDTVEQSDLLMSLE